MFMSYEAEELAKVVKTVFTFFQFRYAHSFIQPQNPAVLDETEARTTQYSIQERLKANAFLACNHFVKLLDDGNYYITQQPLPDQAVLVQLCEYFLQGSAPTLNPDTTREHQQQLNPAARENERQLTDKMKRGRAPVWNGGYQFSDARGSKHALSNCPPDLFLTIIKQLHQYYTQVRADSLTTQAIFNAIQAQRISNVGGVFRTNLICKLNYFLRQNNLITQHNDDLSTIKIKSPLPSDKELLVLFEKYEAELSTQRHLNVLQGRLSKDDETEIDENGPLSFTANH